MNKKLPDYLGKKRIYNPNFKELQFNRDVIKWEVLPNKNIQGVLLRFISANSRNRQGVRIAIDAGKGSVRIGKEVRKGMDIWFDEFPKEIMLECESEEGFLSIYNIFERAGEGASGRQSQMDYSGMLLEVLLEENKNIYRYYCNDTGRKTSFDSLVFEIELL